MKQLVILRHAEAISASTKLADLDRTLSPFGFQQLADINQALRAHVKYCNRIITSPAQRTVQTAQGIMQSIGLPPLQLEQKIYENTIEALLGIIHNLEATETSIMLVGHNPSLSVLLNYLSAKPGNYHLATSGLAILQFAVQSWQQDLERQGEVILFLS